MNVLEKILSDRPDLASLENGKLRLGVNVGLLVLMERSARDTAGMD